MALKLKNALSKFDLAEYAELDCGSFDIKIQQAAVHNESFRAAVAKRAMAAKQKSLVPEKGTLTGSFQEDVQLIVDHVIVGWGERPLVDDDGDEVAFSKENLMELFTGSREGKILFTKIQAAAIDDQVFAVSEEDSKNS